jgi:uncharacterized protein (DUF2141 family)
VTRSGRSLWVVLMLLLAAGRPAAAQDATRACEQISSGMLVQVHGVRSDKGTLVAVLYGDKPDEFLKKGARLARERVPARPGSVALCLDTPRPGVYAVAVYHDENDNRKFDRSWTGLPSEGFGVSNNPKLFLRAPTHGESAVRVGPGQRVVNIDLRY